jgi:hypothetical protein
MHARVGGLTYLWCATTKRFNQTFPNRKIGKREQEGPTQMLDNTRTRGGLLLTHRGRREIPVSSESRVVMLPRPKDSSEEGTGLGHQRQDQSYLEQIRKVTTKCGISSRMVPLLLPRTVRYHAGEATSYPVKTRACPKGMIRSSRLSRVVVDR